MKSFNLAFAAGAAAMFLVPVSAAVAGEKGVVVTEDDAKADDDATVRCWPRLQPT